jgi:AcrR family transcriptional regulator
MLGTRERIVEAAADLFWRAGYPATGMKQIVEHAKAPFGSVYHFFPGGKEQLGAEVVRWSGLRYQQLVEGVLELRLASETSVADAFAQVMVDAGDALAASGWADACPIATVALEMANESELIRAACEETFESWTAALVERFARHGVGVDDASRRDLATTFLMLLEGGFLLARTARSPEPLTAAGRTMRMVVLAASTTPELATPAPSP